MENETDGWKGMTESTEWIHRGRCMTVSMEMTPGSQPSLMWALFTQMNRKDTLGFCHWSLFVCLSKTIPSSIFMLYSKQIKCSVINEGPHGLKTFKTESPLNLQKKAIIIVLGFLPSFITFTFTRSSGKVRHTNLGKFYSKFNTSFLVILHWRLFKKLKMRKKQNYYHYYNYCFLKVI